MDAVEEVKSRLGIEDVVAEYVQLKRAGRNFKGLSPFSNEKTPSFIVSPEKQIWHDFSSGKGGDMFSFVMDMEGLDFKDALELLARKAGIDISQYQTGGASSGNANHKERLYGVLELATLFYQTQLKSNKETLEYLLTKRKFTKETILQWHLGYAPNNGSALIKFLRSKGFNDKEIQNSGLSARTYRGSVQDMFRGRVMIPLQDQQGRVIGFTARLLEDDLNAPKYINTPQTVLYDKSRHVYGLHLAKEAIRKKKYVILVEGNLDVISSHQTGVSQVVATAGTALTEQNLKTLSRLVTDIRLCFDADKAGIAATERAIPIASKVGVSLSIIDIPSGKDPDELIKQDAATWDRIIEQPKYALDWLIERYEKLLDMQSAQGKRQFSDILLPIVRSLSDSVEQDHYLHKLSKIMDVSKEALMSKMTIVQHNNQANIRKKSPKQPLVFDKAIAEITKVQDHLLGLVLINKSLRSYIAVLTPEMLITDEARQLIRFLNSHPDFNVVTTQPKELRLVSDYVKILVLQYEELYQGLELLELQYEAARLQTHVVGQFVKTEKQKLITQLGESDELTTQTLLKRVKELDSLLKQAREDTNG